MLTHTFKPSLGLSERLRKHLEGMTGSWVRKRLPVKVSEQKAAYWDGSTIHIPDLRDSSYTFLLGSPTNLQFSYYCGLTFHEACHYLCRSHKADLDKALQDIPPTWHNLVQFLYNILEDGRVERFGLYRREGSSIYHSLFRLNFVTNSYNFQSWKDLHHEDGFTNDLNHFMAQLFALSKLGSSFVHPFHSEIEKEWVEEANRLLPEVLGSTIPDKSVEGAVKLFSLIEPHLPPQPTGGMGEMIEQYNDLTHSPNKQETSECTESETSWPQKRIEDQHFLRDPFQTLFRQDIKEKGKKNISSGKHSHKARRKRKRKLGDKEEGRNHESLEKQDGQTNGMTSDKIKTERRTTDPIDRESFGLIRWTTALTQLEMRSFFHFAKRSHEELKMVRSDADEEFYFEEFLNDEEVTTDQTDWVNLREGFDHCEDEWRSQAQETLREVKPVVERTTKLFLKLAGLDSQARAGRGIQRTSLRSQRTGEVEMRSSTLSQMIAGSPYVRKKELPAKIKLAIDLAIMVDVTGSMWNETQCGERSGTRLEFASETAMILAEVLDTLKSLYHLPIRFMVVGYAARDDFTPTLEVVKSFEDPWDLQCIHHLTSWGPQGENCDARALYEVTKKLEGLPHLTENKQVIFFMSDGGGEGTDNPTLEKIQEDNPFFRSTGPRPYTDVIRWAKAKKIITDVFMIEAIDDEDSKADMRKALQVFYTENVEIIQNFDQLSEAFAFRLVEALRIHR